MKYNIEGNNDYSGNILETILKRRGIEDIEGFLNIDEGVLEPLENYTNMEEGYNLLMKHINNKSNIHIIVDPDVDGITSSAKKLLYLKDLEVFLGTEINITYHHNKEKKHGIILDDKELKLKKIDLLIVPDAGSNDKEAILHCYENNVEVLILDHHELNEENALETQAVLINPHSSPNVENKNISGVGVVYKFCKYIDKQLNVNLADKYLDLVALGNISDVIDLREKETRYFVQRGLSAINNDFIKEIIEKQSFSMNDCVNITSVGWYVAPMLNATIRVGKPKEIKDMFDALIGIHKEIEYKRKDSIEIHSLQKTMARVCGNIKARQDREVKKSVEAINDKIVNDRLDENKIIMVDVTGILDKNYTGLVANKLTDRYKRPVLLLQNRSDKENVFGGSARNYGRFEIKQLRSYLLDSGYFNMCAGHEGAFGIEIDSDKVEPFLEFVNDDLKDLELTNNYIVDFEIPFSKLTTNMVKQIGQAKDIWGNKISEPLFAITNVRINSRDIELRGERAKTVAFNKKDISFYKRYANEDYFNEFTMKPNAGMNVGRDLNYTIVGKLKVKEYNGKTYNQVEIVDYNVKKENKIVF